MFNPVVPNMTPITQACILGGNGGLVFRYAGHKYCALQVEADYLQRGWREANDRYTYRRTLHYIEVPLLMHLYFGREHGRFFINLGPEIGYCIADDGGKATGSLSDGVQYAKLDHPFDWGLTGGLGGYYRSSRAGIYQIEARFHYSLGTLFGNRTTDYFRNQSNPMILSINLGWMWEIRRKRERER